MEITGTSKNNIIKKKTLTTKKNNKNKHNAELRRADPGTKVTG